MFDGINHTDSRYDETRRSKGNLSYFLQLILPSKVNNNVFMKTKNKIIVFIDKKIMFSFF